MKVFAGDLVISLSTVIEENNLNEDLVNKAHESLDTELFKEIELLLGAKGYAVSSLGVTLKEVANPKEATIKSIKRRTQEAKRNVKSVYGKANIKTFTID
ncbi:hypothetical protein [Alkalihalobacterium chitinilyticum]|uniref:Uncharacterized protein n=1 Tax=Alkalihalobacterium chitinilyticum TaxID=2980103 RepID=A0ABT5VF88_9BACI|nr:hypothetical protein [Alkalihalobacterium chitinilyticum]MDE5414124.1 hypothetical protein [Alkalihalobacterium chitinilyticum]